VALDGRGDDDPRRAVDDGDAFLGRQRGAAGEAEREQPGNRGMDDKIGALHWIS